MNLPPNTIKTTQRKRKLTYRRIRLTGYISAVLFYLALIALLAVVAVKAVLWLGSY